MLDVDSVEGMEYSYVWGCWEISWSIETLVDSYFVWLGLGHGVLRIVHPFCESKTLLDPQSGVLVIF